ncbi:AsmA-like C-terminal region-containing protein [Candidatus Nitrotoga sp. AM1P]|uniref:AsmA-like C-terminal region-containing protein n=1 Tax=Candidatus Nitrotoga sp. AM1P TaxID=2559597 RepID=UPI0010B0E33E|nr:AsmA-like C-terminal region-containing protein [Candidatus Nitrotoga sp. AM1P]BBJ23039.1 hypothetical protein W01_09660 [Candidatus Nitrotoga sp. AM1P]
MDIKIIFIKTSKGEDESKRITNHLSSDIKRALGLIDNKSTVKELMKRAAPSLREALGDMLQELTDGGFIQDKDTINTAVRMAIPRMPIQKNIISSPKFEGLGERQSPINVMHVSAAGALAAEEEIEKGAARIRAEQEAVNVQEKTEAVRLKAEQEAEKVRAEREAELAKVKTEAERARFKAEQEIEKIRVELEGALVKAKEEAETLAKARFEAEAARFKAEQQEAAQAKAKVDAEAKAHAEVEAFRLKAEQEAVKAKAEQEAALARAKAEAERARFKVEQETEKIRAELEGALLKTKEEAKALVKARSEAEAVRFKAGQEAVKARAEQEVTRAKVEAEAKARAVVEAMYLKAEKDVVNIRAKQEAEQAKAKVEMEAAVNARAAAEAARLKAEQEMSKVRSELEAEQAKSQVEAKAKARAEAETARLKGEQEAARIIMKQEAAQAKAKVEMDAKIRAEAEVTRIKEEQETIRVKAEYLATLNKEKAEAKARDEAMVRINKAEQDAAKIKAEQEAAQTVTKAKMEASVKVSVAQMPEMKAVQCVAITRSKPLPWGKIAAGLIVLLFLLAALLPYIWPMQGYVTQIEQKLFAQLGQPVHIGYLRATLLPQPKLELEDVSMGSSQELKASSVVLNFNFSALLNETKAIHSLEINDLLLRAETFDKTLMWLQTAGGDTHYPVARMVLQRARVSNDELNLPPVNGVVNFDGQRRFAKAVLKSVDGKLSMELQPQQSRWQIALAIKQGYVPLLPNILFNELTIKGELGAGEIKFHEIDGSLYGGMLAGSAHLTWLKGWQMQGLVNVKAVQLHDALPQFGIAGEMDGDANFILRGEKLPLLVKTPHLDGKFLVKKGLINKIDLVETSRMPTRKGASSGRTHFDELRGALEIDNNKQHLRQIKISAGVMSANGYVDVAANKQLSGRLNVDLKIRADLGSVPLVLSGTLAEPVWNTRR